MFADEAADYIRPVMCCTIRLTADTLNQQTRPSNIGRIPFRTKERRLVRRPMAVMATMIMNFPSWPRK